MAYKQVRNFNKRNAGTKPFWCLRNVRMGYGIASKYEWAWQNWQNTDKHTGSIPKGVDVPVFFSFWYTLEDHNGKLTSRNWGHIAVKLADGRVWTDGEYFNSVQDLQNNYLSNGKYVGWSTKVNGVQVIKKEARKMANKADLTAIYKHGPLERKRARGEGEDVYLGKSAEFILNDHANSREGKRKAKAEATQDKLVVEQKKRLKELSDKISTLQTELGKRPKIGAVDAALAEANELRKELTEANERIEVLRNEPKEEPLSWQRVIDWVVKQFNGGK